MNQILLDEYVSAYQDVVCCQQRNCAVQTKEAGECWKTIVWESRGAEALVVAKKVASAGYLPVRVALDNRPLSSGRGEAAVVVWRSWDHCGPLGRAGMAPGDE